MPGDQSDSEVQSQAFLDQKWAEFRHWVLDSDPAFIADLATILTNADDEDDPGPLLASLDPEHARSVYWLAKVALAESMHRAEFDPA